jgi:UDP-glucose 4-epimerase
MPELNPASQRIDYYMDTDHLITRTPSDRSGPNDLHPQMLKLQSCGVARPKWDFLNRSFREVSATVGERHLILGGGGFVGRHVALQLARQGHDVSLASRQPFAQEIPSAFAGNIRWQFFELGSTDWDRLVAKMDVVHHYAWSSLPASANADPGGDLLTNVGATVDMLDALHRRGAGRVIFASSGGTVYGKLNQTPVAEDHPLSPINAYGAGKVAAEVYLSLYRAMHGLDCRIARIANPYGAGQNSSHGQGAVTTFIRNALNRQPITIWGTGDVVRDYVYITDVAQCLVTLAAAPRDDKFVFNVGSGVGVSLNDIVAELEIQLDRKLDVRHSESRLIDIPISVLAIERAKKILGWSPIVSFSEGIARTRNDLCRGSEFAT